MAVNVQKLAKMQVIRALNAVKIKKSPHDSCSQVEKKSEKYVR